MPAGKIQPVVLTIVLVLALIAGGASPALAAWNGGHDAIGATNARTAWYFAEGTTRAGFSEYVCLLNPGASPAVAEFTYMLGNGQNISLKYDLPPTSRTTVNVGTQVPFGNDVSIKVSSDGPLVAERSMYFDYAGSWSGGHDVVGAAGPLKDWYFAEGCTRDGFDTYLSLQNPGDSQASLDLDYYCGDGKVETRKGITVGPRSRITVPVHDPSLGIGRSNDFHGDVSIKVHSANGVPVVAERPMYFNYRPYLTGGHDVVGAAAPATAWYFAEGCVRNGFDTFLCLGNPGNKAADINIYYYCADGRNEQRKGIKVPPRSRFTIPVFEAKNGIGRFNDAHGDFSIRVESANGVPVVAERPAYFSYRPFWTGGSDVVGATAPARSWYFAEGCTRPGFDTYLCIENPQDRDASVNITYYCADGLVIQKSGVNIGRESRFTVAVQDPSLGVGRYDDNRGDMSIKVESANGVKVIAERPMYFAGRWRTMDRNSLVASWHRGEFFSGNTKRNCVALTFDMETNGDITGQILDILKSKGVQATCFVTANLPARWGSVVVRMAAEGHEIGNHSVSHPFFTKISYAQADNELGQTEAAVNAVTGFTTKPYFRFPYGARNAGLIAHINALGYSSIYWAVDPQDWSNNSVAQVQATVLGQAHPGSIILMHDRAKTIAALPGIIDGLRARGFDLVTLSDLLYPGP